MVDAERGAVTLEAVISVPREVTLDNLTHEDLAADVSTALAYAGSSVAARV